MLQLQLIVLIPYIERGLCLGQPSVLKVNYYINYCNNTNAGQAKVTNTFKGPKVKLHETIQNIRFSRCLRGPLAYSYLRIRTGKHPPDGETDDRTKQYIFFQKEVLSMAYFNTS